MNSFSGQVGMSRVLITGINGFVGSHLVRWLKSRSCEIFGFDLNDSDLDAELFQGEINDEVTLRQVLADVRPDLIFHLAGVLKSPQPHVLYTVNLLGTVTLLEQVVKSDLRPQVVIASSSAVYGRSSTSDPVNEDVELQPLTHYAVSKISQEAAALRYYDSFQLPVKIVRMFNLLGPGQPADLACSSFARQIALAELQGGNEIVTGSLDTSRDFVDVRDAVQAFDLIAQRGKPGEIYNVCSGQGVSLRKCLDDMMSMSSIRFNVRVDEHRVQKNDVPMQVGDAGKLHRLAGWSPQISLKTSLSDLLNDWRQRVKSGVEW